VVLELTAGIQHFRVAEVPFLNRQPESGKSPVRHGHLLDLGGHDLEDAGLQDHLRVSLVDFGNLLPGSFEVPKQVGLAAPETKAPPNELGPSGFQHPDVVIEVPAAIQQALHRN